MKKLALALGGGGARGLAHIGFLKVIEDNKLPIARIAGCSMGAMVGGLYCYRPDSRVIKKIALEFIKNPMFKEFNFDDFASLGAHANEFSEKVLFALSKLKVGISLFKTLAKSSIYDTVFVEKMYSLLPDSTIKNLAIPFGAATTDLYSGREVFLNSGSLRLAMRASSSIPGYFPPVKYKNYLLVDGGVSNVVPISDLPKKKDELIIGVDVEPDILKTGSLSSGVDIMMRSEMIRNYRLKEYRIANADKIVNCEMGSLSWADFRYFDDIIKSGEKAAHKLLPWLEKNL